MTEFGRNIPPVSTGSSTLKIAGIIIAGFILIGVFMFSVLCFVTAYNYSTTRLDKMAYTRGINSVGATDIKMECEEGKEICIEHAVQICTGANSNSNADENYENEDMDPIYSSKDQKSDYGKFNPETTVDLKSEFSQKCGGKPKCDFPFTGEEKFPNGKTCSVGNVQLISAYTCIPKGQVCK